MRTNSAVFTSAYRPENQNVKCACYVLLSVRNVNTHSLTLQRGVTSTARHSENITCRGVTSTARHAALSHSFDYISTT